MFLLFIILYINFTLFVDIFAVSQYLQDKNIWQNLSSRTTVDRNWKFFFILFLRFRGLWPNFKGRLKNSKFLTGKGINHDIFPLGISNHESVYSSDPLHQFCGFKDDIWSWVESAQRKVPWRGSYQFI